VLDCSRPHLLLWRLVCRVSTAGLSKLITAEKALLQQVNDMRALQVLLWLAWEHWNFATGRARATHSSLCFSHHRTLFRLLDCTFFSKSGAHYNVFLAGAQAIAVT